MNANNYVFRVEQPFPNLARFDGNAEATLAGRNIPIAATLVKYRATTERQENSAFDHGTLIFLSR